MNKPNSTTSHYEPFQHEDTMNEYIFYTTAGYTLAPDGETKVENCQVLGFAKGRNAAEAKARLLTEQPWISELGYADAPIFSRQVV